MPTPPAINPPEAVSNEHDLQIEVYFGTPALDYGIATIPKILPRFWPFLACEGERLNERQFALLLQVLLLRDVQDYELRVGNLPMASSLITLERDKKVLRRLGLVFTERIYYPTEAGKPPRMQAQRWDFRSLFFNLEQVAQLWATRQKSVIALWEAGGRRGNRPVYNFPADFTYEVTIPVEVALDILKGVFYPIPALWEQRARALLAALPTGPNKSGRQKETETPAAPTGPETSGTLPTSLKTSGTPTGPNKSGRGPTGPNTRGHLLEDEEEEEGEPAQLEVRVLRYFGNRRGIPDYQPTAKELAALQKLLAESFTYEQIIAGIDDAFSRPSKPRYFTHCAAIARDLARRHQENQPPEARIQPETRGLEALPAVESPPAAPQVKNALAQSNAPEPALVIDANLVRAVEVYRSTDREISSDLLARFRLMAARCDAAAKSHQSTGGDWLADALASALGVARPGSLLNYADAVLDDWIRNGRADRSRPVEKPKQTRPKKGAESGVSRALQDYFDQHGDLFDGHSD